MSIIPRKFSNSKGNNLYTEIKETKKWNRLLRETKTMHQNQKKEAMQTTKGNTKNKS